MTRTLEQILLLTAKDLRIEARTRQTVALIVMLGILIIVVLSLGLGPQQQTSPFAATAILWVAYLFGGVLCFEKTMSVERDDAALAGLLLAPIDRGAIYAGKLLTNLILMLALALVITPVAMIFFGFDLSAAPLGFAGVMGLSMLGFAAVGTLFAATVGSGRVQGGLLAVLVFPISLPLVITSTQMLLAMFRDGTSPFSGGLWILVAFDAIYLTASWMVFEWVVEP